MSKKSYVEYWQEKERDSKLFHDALRPYVIATWKCGCKLGYAAIAYSPIKRCKNHNDMWRWFGLPIPPVDQLKEVEGAGIVTLEWIQDDDRTLTKKEA